MTTTTRALKRISRLVLIGLSSTKAIDDARALELIERVAKRELDGNIAADDSSLRWEVGLFQRAKRGRAEMRRAIAEDFDEMFALVESVVNAKPAIGTSATGSPASDGLSRQTEPVLSADIGAGETGER